MTANADRLDDKEASRLLARLSNYASDARSRTTLRALSAELNERAERAKVKPGDDPLMDAEAEREKAARQQYDDEAMFGRIVLRALRAGDVTLEWHDTTDATYTALARIERRWPRG